MAPMRMNLDFGNLSNGKTNSMITCKSLETGKLFGNTMLSVKFHSCLLRLLEFRAVIHWTPLFLEIWVPALLPCYLGAWKHCSFPGAAPQPMLSQSKFMSKLLDLPCPCAQHSALGKMPWAAGNDTKISQTNCIKAKMWPFPVSAAFPIELALPILPFTEPYFSFQGIHRRTKEWRCETG